MIIYNRIEISGQLLWHQIENKSGIKKNIRTSTLRIRMNKFSLWNTLHVTPWRHAFWRHPSSRTRKQTLSMPLFLLFMKHTTVCCKQRQKLLYLARMFAKTQYNLFRVKSIDFRDLRKHCWNKVRLLHLFLGNVSEKLFLVC